MLQAACDDNNLEPDDVYGNVISDFPNLRMLITISDQDAALNKWYPLAGEINIFHRDTRKALGAGGPSIAVGNLFNGDIGQLDIDVDFNAKDPATTVNLKHKLVIANLSDIHKYRRNNPAPPESPLYKADSWGGSHSDIFFDQLYSVIAKFLYG